MKYDFIQDEWQGLVEDLDCKGFTDSIESAAAVELIRSKQYVPVLNQMLSGLSTVESAEQILNNYTKFLYLIAFYACESMDLSVEYTKDGKAHLTIWVCNVPLFLTTASMGIAAALYHLTGTLPLKVSIICEGRLKLEIFEEAAGTVTDLFNLDSVEFLAQGEDQHTVSI